MSHTTWVQCSLNSVAERPKCNDHDNGKRNTTAYPPKVALGQGCVNDTSKIHTVIRCEKRKRKEDDGNACENENGFVLGIRYNRQFVLFDGSKLEKL